MPLKQLIFIALSLGFIPTAAWFAIRYQWAERLLFAGALFSTCYLIDINLVSVEAYRGDTRGFEFGVTDWMVIALLIVMVRSPRWRHRRPDPFPPNSALLVTYLVIAMLSVATAYVPLYAGFGVFKLIRAMAVYWNVAKLNASCAWAGSWKNSCVQERTLRLLECPGKWAAVSHALAGALWRTCTRTHMRHARMVR